MANNDTSVHTFLLAFSVKVAQREQLIDLTVKQPLQAEFRSFISQIQALAPEGRSKSVPLLELLADSLAPSIYGHKLIKKAVVLQLLGGIRRQFHSTIVRGDINILLIGSPGCGKSQILRAAQNLSRIAISASGRSASGAGLTAAVVIDKNSGARSLEAGAFVLADQGLLCIDEFDKLQQYDRAAIHEAMEQQTISVSKAGIIVTLNARCSVLAAANFIYGGWDPDKSIGANINLPDSLLSRFDLIFVIKDDTKYDQKIAEHVVQNHQLSKPYEKQTTIETIQNTTQQFSQSTMSTATKSAKQGTSQNQKLFDDIPQEAFMIYSAQQHQELFDRFCTNMQLTPQQIQQVQTSKFLINPQYFKQLLEFLKSRCTDEPYLSSEAQIAISKYYSLLRK